MVMEQYNSTQSHDFLAFNRSKRFVFIIWGYHLILIGTFLSVHWSIALQTVFTVVTLWSLVSLLRNRQELNGELSGLIIGEKQEWVRVTYGQHQTIEIIAATLISPALTIIRYRDENDQTQSLLIFGDALSTQAHRQLRLALKQLDGISS